MDTSNAEPIEILKNTPERPPLGAMIIFGIGQLGWALASFGVINLISYFYLPPESADQATFPTFIYQGAFLGFLTVVGLVTALGRVFDAFTDPMIAGWSDRCTWKRGKRKLGMIIGIIPFSVFSILVFMPLSMDNTTLNTIWFAVTLFCFYISFTLYVVPYTALIGELGHHPKDRLLISTVLSISWALGFVLGNMIYAIKDGLDEQMGAVRAFQTGVTGLSIFAFLCMLVPIFFLKETRYSRQSTNSFSFFQSLGKVVGNRNFLIFTFSDLMYWLSLTVIQVGMVYNITVLLGLPESQASLFSTLAFFLSFVCYIPINVITPKLGKKKMVIAGFALFALTFSLGSLLGILPGPLMGQFYLLVLLSAIPLAIFGILPNAIIADIVNDHEKDKGENLSGMYFAFRNFMMKLGTSLGFIVFTSLLLLGKSVENPLGIRLANASALLFCVIGLVLFLFYRSPLKKGIE